MYELEDLATQVPFCKDCVKREKVASSSDSSSSTDTDKDTDAEEKDEHRKESMVIAKLLEKNLRKEAEEKERAGKRPRDPPMEEEDSDGFEPGRTKARQEAGTGAIGGASD